MAKDQFWGEVDVGLHKSGDITIRFYDGHQYKMPQQGVRLLIQGLQECLAEAKKMAPQKDHFDPRRN